MSTCRIVAPGVSSGGPSPNAVGGRTGGVWRPDRAGSGVARRRHEQRSRAWPATGAARPRVRARAGPADRRPESKAPGHQIPVKIRAGGGPDGQARVASVQPTGSSRSKRRATGHPPLQRPVSLSRTSRAGRTAGERAEATAAYRWATRRLSEVAGARVAGQLAHRRGRVVNVLEGAVWQVTRSTAVPALEQVGERVGIALTGLDPVGGVLPVARRRSEAGNASGWGRMTMTSWPGPRPGTAAPPVPPPGPRNRGAHGGRPRGLRQLRTCSSTVCHRRHAHRVSSTPERRLGARSVTMLTPVLRAHGLGDGWRPGLVGGWSAACRVRR